MNWIILIVLTITFFAGAIWYTVDTKEARQEEQDDFYNANTPNGQP